MAEVFGNVNVKYNPCKSIAQLKSTADYILGKRKEQIAEGIEKTRPELYNAFGCNRDNFANSLIMTRKMHQKKYSRYKPKEILAQKLSISFHPDDNDKLTYEEAYKMAEQFAREFFWSKGYEVLFAVHTDTDHIHAHFLVSNCTIRRMAHLSAEDRRNWWKCQSIWEINVGNEDLSILFEILITAKIRTGKKSLLQNIR